MNVAVGFVAVVAASAIASQGERPRLVFKAAHVVVSPGKAIPRGVIVVEDGRITSVGTDLGVPRGAAVVDYGEATIAPAFVDAHSQLGAAGEITDTSEAFTPGVRAIDALRPASRDLARAAAEGIVTFGLAPTGENVIAGLGAVVRTAGPIAGRTIRDEAFLEISLAPSALRRDRYPATIGAALSEIRKRFEAPAGDAARDADARALAIARRSGEVWLEVSDPSALRLGLALARDLSLRPVVVATGDLVEVASEIAAAKAPVVLPPLDFRSRQAELRAPAAYAKAGVEIAFGTFEPEHAPLALRLSASLAAASGLDAKQALAAITTVPARLLGVADRVGTLEAGRAADLVVLSGDPVALTSGVRAVYAGGTRIWPGNAP
ncbi:MAG TPA: amidohydrolase family protein [Planctomycetota bacterium]|nr:amidohydrolase family protein [Planctomycetota bacterium]